MMASIILASASASRGDLLKNAGIVFTATPANINEREIERPIAAAGSSPAELATALAEAKAVAVGRDNLGALVIGADQVLESEGRRWNKPANMAEARDQLTALSGKTHELHSAVCVVRESAVDWRYCETARMTMRHLSPETVDRYLAEAGERVLSSVGAYQIEGPGIRLFDRIDGDYFSILGLPLLPLLSYLRDSGAMR